jgi:biotin carboxyl carrier protein
VINVLQGKRYAVLTEHTKNYLLGGYGRAPGKVNQELVKRVIEETGKQPITHRPADDIEPEFEKDKAELIQKLGRQPKSDEDVVTYALFPEVALEFFDIRDGLKKEEPPAPKKPAAAPAPAPAAAAAAPAGESSYRVTVGGTTYDVRVEDVGGGEAALTNVATAAPAPAPAPSAYAGSGTMVKAPLSGDVLKVLAAEGSAVKEGQEIIILEAMKMETKVVSPKNGKIARVFVVPGDKVESGDPLAAIE